MRTQTTYTTMCITLLTITCRLLINFHNTLIRPTRINICHQSPSRILEEVIRLILHLCLLINIAFITSLYTQFLKEGEHGGLVGGILHGENNVAICFAQGLALCDGGCIGVGSAAVTTTATTSS